MSLDPRPLVKRIRQALEFGKAAPEAAQSEYERALTWLITELESFEVTAEYVNNGNAVLVKWRDPSTRKSMRKTVWPGQSAFMHGNAVRIKFPDHEVSFLDETPVGSNGHYRSLFRVKRTAPLN